MFFLYSILICFSFISSTYSSEVASNLEEREINNFKVLVPQGFKLPEGYYDDNSQITQQSISLNLVNNFWKDLYEEKNVEKALLDSISAIVNDVNNENEAFINTLEDKKPGITRQIREKRYDPALNKELNRILELMISPISDDDE